MGLLTLAAAGGLYRASPGGWAAAGLAWAAFAAGSAFGAALRGWAR